MKILLDTHTFIWWDDDHSKLSSSVLTVLRDPQNDVYLSLVSIWEMQIKSQLGKLKFSVPLQKKVREQQATNKLILLPITAEHIYALQNLPHHHREPFDRLLIAQALIEELQFATRDHQISQYTVNVFWD